MILTLYELQKVSTKSGVPENELIIRFSSRNKNLAYGYSYVYNDSEIELSSNLLWEFLDLEDTTTKVKTRTKETFKTF